MSEYEFDLSSLFENTELLEQVFVYSVAVTQERRDANKFIDTKCFELLKQLLTVVSDKNTRLLLYYLIQQVRTVSKQAVTLDELNRIQTMSNKIEMATEGLMSYLEETPDEPTT